MLFDGTVHDNARRKISVRDAIIPRHCVEKRAMFVTDNRTTYLHHHIISDLFDMNWKRRR